MTVLNTNPTKGATNKGITVGEMDIHEPVDGIVWMFDNKGRDGQTVKEEELAQAIQEFYNSRF